MNTFSLLMPFLDGSLIWPAVRAVAWIGLFAALIVGLFLM